MVLLSDRYKTIICWAVNVPSRNDEYMTSIILLRKKYMTLTDYSLDSRMRHMTSLLLRYKALEIEAEKMKQIDKINPKFYVARIFCLQRQC
jgi:Mlc titration factor MtfA (ptsG expression regulator)